MNERNITRVHQLAGAALVMDTVCCIIIGKKINRLELPIFCLCLRLVEGKYIFKRHIATMGRGDQIGLASKVREDVIFIIWTYEGLIYLRSLINLSNDLNSSPVSLGPV